MRNNFIYSFFALILTTTCVYAAQEMREEDVLSFSYQMGIFESVHEIRNDNFLKSNKVSMMEAYNDLIGKIKEFPKAEEYMLLLSDGHNEVKKNPMTYIPIKLAEKYLETIFPTLLKDEVLLHELNTNINLMKNLGIWQYGEFIYMEQKKYFTSLKMTSKVSFNLIETAYNKGKQEINDEFPVRQLLLKYEDSGSALMTLFKKYNSFFSKQNSSLQLTQK